MFFQCTLWPHTRLCCLKLKQENTFISVNFIETWCVTKQNAHGPYSLPHVVWMWTNNNNLLQWVSSGTLLLKKFLSEYQRKGQQSRYVSLLHSALLPRLCYPGIDRHIHKGQSQYTLARSLMLINLLIKPWSRCKESNTDRLDGVFPLPVVAAQQSGFDTARWKPSPG